MNKTIFSLLALCPNSVSTKPEVYLCQLFVHQNSFDRVSYSVAPQSFKRVLGFRLERLKQEANPDKKNALVCQTDTTLLTSDCVYPMAAFCLTVVNIRALEPRDYLFFNSEHFLACFSVEGILRQLSTIKININSKATSNKTC